MHGGSALMQDNAFCLSPMEAGWQCLENSEPTGRQPRTGAVLTKVTAYHSEDCGLFECACVAVS